MSLTVSMKRYKSDLFEDVRMPATFEQVVDTVIEPNTAGEEVVRIWRGQDNIAWPIHSTAYRRVAIDKPDPTERDIRYYEKRLLERATHRGYRNLDGRVLSDMELLARLRHHGAATRLVDGTRSALVGLYFACVGAPRTTGLLIGLHCDYLGGMECLPEDEPYDDAVEGLESLEHPQTFEPTVVSPRIAAQHSQFLYSSVSDEKYGSLQIQKAEDSTLAIAISPKLKRRCLQALSDAFDIRLETLFPDLDGFGTANNAAINQWAAYRW